MQKDLCLHSMENVPTASDGLMEAMDNLKLEDSAKPPNPQRNRRQRRKNKPAKDESNVTIDDRTNQSLKNTANTLNDDSGHESSNETRVNMTENVETDNNNKQNKQNSKTATSTELPKPKPKRNKGRKNRGLDRCYGKFACTICKKSWESAWVWAIAGTKTVVYKQCCKQCPDAWTGPWDVQPIRCSACEYDPCECRCEDCELLVHYRWRRDEEIEGSVVDEAFDYCMCDKKSKRKSGENKDMKKRHLSEYCQKCQSGRPCRS